MSTSKSVKVKTTPRPKQIRRSLRDQRVLWLAQDIFARAVTQSHPNRPEYTADNLARSAIRSAKLFWRVANKEKP